MTATIQARVDCKIEDVWRAVTCVASYPEWRSDVVKVVIVDDVTFEEYDKSGFVTRFFTTRQERYNFWEFDIDNANIKSRWTGKFFDENGHTRVIFTEKVEAKKFFLHPFLRGYLKRQQSKFVADLEKYLNT